MASPTFICFIVSIVIMRNIMCSSLRKQDKKKKLIKLHLKVLKSKNSS